jgi:hypothetical protein
MSIDSIAFGVLKFVGKWTPGMKGAFNVIADHWGRRVCYPSHESYTTTLNRSLGKKDQTLRFKGYGKYTYLNNLDHIDEWIRLSNEFNGSVGQAYEDLAQQMIKNKAEISVEFADAEPSSHILYKASGVITSVVNPDVETLIPILKFVLVKEKNYDYNSKNLNNFGFYALAREYDAEVNYKPIVNVAFEGMV